MSFVGARTDVYRPNEVRAVLAPLAKLAEAHGCAILALRHIIKSKGGKAIYAGQGSIDFTATARSVLLAGSSPHDAGDHALLHIKSNLSALGSPLGYRVDQGGFSWTGESRLTAADLLAAEVAGEERAAGEEACTFLREGVIAQKMGFQEGAQWLSPTRLRATASTTCWGWGLESRGPSRRSSPAAR